MPKANVSNGDFNRPAESQKAHFSLTKTELFAGAVILLFFLSFTTGVPLKSAHRAHTAMWVNNIQIAVLNYQLEYDCYPVPSGTLKKDTYYSSTDERAWGAMTIALCGEDPAHPDRKVTSPLATIPNERGIQFLTLKASELDTRLGVGVIKQDFPDSHGNPQFFFMAIDSNGDGVLGDKDEAKGKLPDFGKNQVEGAVVYAKVVVWANCDQDPGDPTHMKLWIKTKSPPSP